eukprot:sb/3469550/
MPAGKDGDPFSVPTDCQHRILAVEPRNPASPPKTLKIHRQRTVNLRQGPGTRFLTQVSYKISSGVPYTFNKFHMFRAFAALVYKCKGGLGSVHTKVKTKILILTPHTPAAVKISRPILKVTILQASLTGVKILTPVLRPGYMYAEPVLHDIPFSTEALTPQGVENLIKIAEGMRPITPRIDNFSHHPPSQTLRNPPYHVPRSPSSFVVSGNTTTSKFTHGSKCSSGR